MQVACLNKVPPMWERQGFVSGNMREEKYRIEGMHVLSRERVFETLPRLIEIWEYGATHVTSNRGEWNGNSSNIDKLFKLAGW